MKTRIPLMSAIAVLLCLPGLTAFAGPPGQSAAEVGGSEPFVTTLDNGVTVAIIENHEAPVVAVRLYVKAGSMTEEEYLGCGMTHFLEHLISGGSTVRRTEAESRAILDSIGAQCNAYTTKNHTCYYISTASRFFDVALDLVTDWVMNCTVSQTEFDREFEVVQREMELRSTNPNRALQELMSGLMFKEHPVRHPVIGYPEAFRTITRDDILKYYRRMYVPNNVIFVVAGDIERNAALGKIREAFAPFERRPVPSIVFPEEPRQLGPREDTKQMPVGQAYMRVAFRTIPLSHPDLYPLDLISYVLSRGDSSRLVFRLRERERLVSTITSWSYTPGYDAGEFGIQATLDPANIPEAKAAIMQELQRIAEEGVTPEELARAKRQKIADHVFALQTAEAQASSLGTDLLSAHDAQFSKSYVERIQEVAAEEIGTVAAKYFTEQNRCVGVVRPPETAGSPASAGHPDDRPNEASSIEKITLGNGLRVLIKRNPSQPVAAIRAVFLAGLRAEPQGQRGVSLYTARMMPRGAAGRSAQEIAEIFDAMGGQFGASSGNNSLYVSAQCLREDLPETIRVMSDCIRRPDFPPEEVERLRALLVAARKRQKDDWHAELIEAFKQRFYEAHPYRYSTLGTIEELQAIQRSDLVAFHARYCVPNNMVLAVFGDVDHRAVEALVKQQFGDWQRKPDFTPPDPSAPSFPQENQSVEITTQHDVGAIFLGYPGFTFQDTRARYVADVLDAVSSGIRLPRGRLHEALRGGERGLVYEVHAYNFVGFERGYFGAYAGCESDQVERVSDIMVEELERLRSEPITPDELRAARRTCITADVLDRQTSGSQAMESALNELYGLGYDYADKYEEQILSVSAEEVQALANELFGHHLLILMRPGEADEPVGL